jgi:hypothetical protein
MVMAKQGSRWQLIFTFPNFVPPADSPYVSDADGIAICAGTDERLRLLVGGHPGGRMRLLLKRFWTHSGVRYTPGCLLVRKDVVPWILDAEALRAFRNICSLVTTTHGWGAVLDGVGVRPILWSDSFKFGLYSPGQTHGYVSLHGAIQGYESVPRMRKMRFEPDTAFDSLRELRPGLDKELLARLLVAWRQVYVRRRQRKVYRALFRSMDVAFHAGLFPSDGLTGASDAGLRLASAVGQRVRSALSCGMGEQGFGPGRPRRRALGLLEIDDPPV